MLLILSMTALKFNVSLDINGNQFSSLFLSLSHTHSLSLNIRQYSLCCLEGRIVSAGAGNKISMWRSGRERSEDWTLSKWFDTEEAGIWSLVVCKGRLISGGVDGTVRVWI
jgi:WD40 repeat protein